MDWLGSRFSWSRRIGKAQARLGWLASTGKVFNIDFVAACWRGMSEGGSGFGRFEMA